MQNMSLLPIQGNIWIKDDSPGLIYQEPTQQKKIYMNGKWISVNTRAIWTT